MLSDWSVKCQQGGDIIGKLAVIDISENGKQIGEKLLVLLDKKQKEELVQYVLRESHNLSFHAWNEEYTEVTMKAIHHLMSRLRQKLQVADDIPEYIVSVRGVGYKFDAGT